MDPVNERPGAESVDGEGREGDDEGLGPTSDEAGPEGESEGESEGEGEEEAGGEGEAGSRDPLRFNSWMKRSATGAVMTGIAVGLQQALELPRQEPAFVIEASGEPDDPNRAIDLHFDPDNPADTVAIIRRPPPPEAAVEPDEPT